MEAEDLVLYDGRHGQVVEQICEALPHVGVPVFSEALVVEAVNLGDLAGLVVAPEDSDSVLEPDLERNKQGDGLDGVVASVDVVAHEEVVGLWDPAPDPEELHEVQELAMDVPAYCHRNFNGLHISFLA